MVKEILNFKKYGNIETWLSEKIESVIYSLKAIQSGK